MAKNKNVSNPPAKLNKAEKSATPKKPASTPKPDTGRPVKKSTQQGKRQTKVNAADDEESSPEDQHDLLCSEYIRQCARECDLDCSDQPPTMEASGDQSQGVGAGGERIAKLLAFLAKVLPLLLLMAKPKTESAEGGPPKMGASADGEEQQPTPMMGIFGLSSEDIVGYAEHIVHLVETQGDRGIRIARGLLLFIQAVTTRDLGAIFSVINQETVDVQEFVKAVREEFGINQPVEGEQPPAEEQPKEE